VLYYLKVTKFVKLDKFGILEDFRVLYYIKITKSLNLQSLIFMKIFILHKSHEVRQTCKF